ncbi:hypothetical protein NLA06_02265 [Desulfomicrobium sp. ZS1]|jgi:hypothetical protein|uniref:hypothetical protein n=1 Tax=Desulfomicrobium sp. ZS1 TaxID=2952228 RepID=UPI0020B44A17|nr:hypothetical protein [Desulfomicrobium sp. ZS1]UTF50735.1 hypothetical protein NLA06_02265 [Desulfomicrobium sp. ZS1]
MLLDQKLDLIRDEKAKLGICCDLHRHLAHVELRELVSGALRTVSNVALGFAVLQQIIQRLRDRKDRRQ